LRFTIRNRLRDLELPHAHRYIGLLGF